MSHLSVLWPLLGDLEVISEDFSSVPILQSRSSTFSSHQWSSLEQKTTSFRDEGFFSSERFSGNNFDSFEIEDLSTLSVFKKKSTNLISWFSIPFYYEVRVLQFHIGWFKTTFLLIFRKTTLRSHRLSSKGVHSKWEFKLSWLVLSSVGGWKLKLYYPPCINQCIYQQCHTENMFLALRMRRVWLSWCNCTNPPLARTHGNIKWIYLTSNYHLLKPSYENLKQEG